MFLYLIALYGTCHLYGATKQQQLFGKRGFTGIRVRYNGKRPATADFFFVHRIWLNPAVWGTRRLKKSAKVGNIGDILKPPPGLPQGGWVYPQPTKGGFSTFRPQFPHSHPPDLTRTGIILLL
jgi:hypothetical protein